MIQSLGADIAMAEITMTNVTMTNVTMTNDILIEIGSHWPARNGMARTSCKLARALPGQQHYRGAEHDTLTSDGSVHISRTMLPSGVLDGATTIMIYARCQRDIPMNVITLNYALGKLTTACVEYDHGTSIEYTDYRARPRFVTSATSAQVVFPVRSGQAFIEFLRGEPYYHDDHPRRRATALTQLEGDLHVWYRKNEDAINTPTWLCDHDAIEVYTRDSRLQASLSAAGIELPGVRFITD